MKKSKDEIVLILGVSLSFTLLLLSAILEYVALVGSLVVLVCTAMFYGFTFFGSNHPYKKLAYFILLLFFTVGYFALVYKSFGIVDTSSGEVIIPDWINAFYFSVVTWSTLGYGDFKPTEPMKIWVMAEALMGYIFMGLIVGKVIYLAQARGRESA